MDFLLSVVRCPRTGPKLFGGGGRRITTDGALAYRLENGIPVLLAGEAVEMAP